MDAGGHGQVPLEAEELPQGHKNGVRRPSETHGPGGGHRLHAELRRLPGSAARTVRRRAR